MEVGRSVLYKVIFAARLKDPEIKLIYILAIQTIEVSVVEL